MDDSDVFASIGEAGFARIVSGFYRRVPDDPILGPMYPPQELAAAETRLRDFLVGRFGGPPRYIEQRGHPRLRLRHAPFPIDGAARERWLELMDAALSEADVPQDVATFLGDFFRAVATMLVNRPSP